VETYFDANLVRGFAELGLPIRLDQYFLGNATDG
jgi:hypothetical protein